MTLRMIRCDGVTIVCAYYIAMFVLQICPPNIMFALEIISLCALNNPTSVCT